MFLSAVRVLWAAIGFVVGLVPFSNVFAADDAGLADKSSYTLFDPVPDTMLRAFSTDRPGKTSGAYTVDAGHYQVEGDFLNWIRPRQFIARDVVQLSGCRSDIQGRIDAEYRS